jgi:hypothetical protein
VILFVELEATSSVDLEAFIELSDFVMGKFSVMGHCYGLVEQ